MRTIILRTGLALVVAASLACNDDAVDPNATGSIVLQIVLGEAEQQEGAAPALGESAPAAAVPGEALTHLDSAKATVTGPMTQTITLTRGATNFTGTFTSLPVGTYTVEVVGYDQNAVDYFGRTTGVAVTAGGTASPTVTFSSFVPAISGVPGTTTAFRLNATFSTIATATGYRVELANNANFSPVAASLSPSASPVQVTVSGTGTWYLRARAVSATAPSGGNWSAATRFDVVTDLRTSGDSIPVAPNLGFFAAATVTLDSLNIAPAADVDFFSVSSCNGDSLTVTAQTVSLTPASPLVSSVRIYNAAGRLLGSNDGTGSADAQVKIGPTTDGAYKVRVSGNGSTQGHYKLQVQPKQGANNTGTACRQVPLAVNAIASGYLHTCAVRTNGFTDCWGNNANSQLGNGTNTISTSPVRVSGGLTFQSLAAGNFHSCGQTSAGTTYCWGANGAGQLGDATTTERNTPTGVSAGVAMAAGSVRAGGSFTCGLNTSGNAYCWGSNLYGQLGNGTNTNSSVPVAVSFGFIFTSLGVGEFHACGTVGGGATYCWGRNNEGQLGNATFTNANTPVLVSGSGSTLFFQGVTAGGNHTCARTNPEAYCWGSNDEAQLGNGTFTDATTPVAVGGGFTFNSLTVGRNHTCGMSTAGVALCWGRNFSGQLGDGSTSVRSSPVSLAGGFTFQTVSAGGHHTCGILVTSGDAYCWGLGSFGQTGDGSALDHTGPVPVSGNFTIKSVGAGGYHTCGVTTNSAGECWGQNGFGQVGDATNIDRNSPVVVAGTYQSASAGLYHSCGTTTGGTLFCWGLNTDGQVGDFTNTNRSSPVTVSGAYQAVTAGGFHTCALSGSTVFCWGYNIDGELGRGTNINSSSPGAVTGTYQSVSAGLWHTCAVRSGVVDCWGFNSNGQLGNGTTTSRNTPGTISSTASFQSVTTGGYHTCALTSAGAAYCWGYNADGAVGDGSFTDRLTPVLVSGALTFQSISAGEFHTCGITTTTNVLYCWGYNFWGQIGNGAFSNRNTPTAVGGLIAFQAVAAGALHTCGYSTSGSGYCWGNNERGQLGYGTRVIRTTPAAVVTGPAAAPPLFTGGYSEVDWMRSGEHLRAAPRWGEPAVAGKLEPHRPRSADR